MKNFEWATRYSSTDEPDKQGRWARICHYKDLNIAWVNMIEHDDKKIFTISGHFPVNGNDMPDYFEKTDTFEKAKEMVESEFMKFLDHVNGRHPDNEIKFFLSIKKLDKCLFSRRLGFRGTKIGKCSAILRIFGKNIF